MSWQPTRDFTGYGANPPDPKWPNGAKLALSFVLNYEEGGENTVLNGDAGSELYLHEVPGGSPILGERNRTVESQFDYGARAGVWRILRAFAARKLDKGIQHPLDVTTSRTLMGHAYPMPGLHSKYYDQEWVPLVEVVQDTVGRHDAFAMACASKYYDDIGYPGHANCSDNFNGALAQHGVEGRPGWMAVNLFFNTNIDAHGVLISDEPWSRPGDYVLMRALTDIVNKRASEIETLRYRHEPPKVDPQAPRLGRNYTQQSDRGVTVARACLRVAYTAALPAQPGSRSKATCPPTIVARTGGLAEIMEGTEASLMFEPGNAKELATRIERVLMNPHVSQKMQAQGTEVLHARFSWDAIARATIGAYEIARADM